MASSGAIIAVCWEYVQLANHLDRGKFHVSKILHLPYVQGAMSAQWLVSVGTPSKEHPDAHSPTMANGCSPSFRGPLIGWAWRNIDCSLGFGGVLPTRELGNVSLEQSNGSQVPGNRPKHVADRMLKLSAEDVGWRSPSRMAEAKIATGEKWKTRAIPAKVSGKPNLALPLIDIHREAMKIPALMEKNEMELENDTLLINQTGCLQWFSRP